MKCGRCSVEVDRPERCWWCGGALCASCWDEIGHCGHADADQANRVSAAMTPEERREMAQAIAGRDEGEEGA